MNRINRRSLINSASVLAGSSFLFHRSAEAHQNQTGNDSVLPASAHHRTSTGSLMVETANRFLAALSSEQRANASFKFEDDDCVCPDVGHSRPDRVTARLRRSAGQRCQMYADRVQPQANVILIWRDTKMAIAIRSIAMSRKEIENQPETLASTLEPLPVQVQTSRSS